MQIYKTTGYDLLHPEAENVDRIEQLPEVRPLINGDSFDFQNLSERKAANFYEAMQIFHQGNTQRVICKTQYNDSSSRSHCILMIIVKTKNK